MEDQDDLSYDICTRTSSSTTSHIGIVEDQILINNANRLISFGKSNVTDQEVASLFGNYEKMPMNFNLNDSDIILKLTKILKPNGSDRFICATSTKLLEAAGLITPNWVKLIDPHLDIRTTIMKIISIYANYNNIKINNNDDDDYNNNNKNNNNNLPDLTLQAYDLTNAYANILLKNSNIYFKTNTSIWRLNQPIQGLNTAGTIAPAIIHDYFKKLIKRVRRKLKKRHNNYMLDYASYSDNMLILTNYPDETKAMMDFELGPKQNQEQFKDSREGTFRTLGFRWSIKNKKLFIRRPSRYVSKEHSSYYNYVIGSQPFIMVQQSNKLAIYSDGVSRITPDKGHQSTYAAGLYQKSRLLYAVVNERNGIDQSISEALGIQLGDKIRKDLNFPVQQYSDSEININISNLKRARQSPERFLLSSNQLSFVPGHNNPADILTRDPGEILKWKRTKYFKESKFSSPTTRTRTSEVEDQNTDLIQGPWGQDKSEDFQDTDSNNGPFGPTNSGAFVERMGSILTIEPVEAENISALGEPPSGGDHVAPQERTCLNNT